MKKYLGFLFAGLLLITGITVKAQDTLYLVHSANPGGVITPQNEALKTSLEKKGFKIESVRTNSCKSAETWIKNNRDKPIVMVYHIEEEAYRQLSPNADDACDIGFQRQHLLTITTPNYSVVCSMLPPQQARKKFFEGNHTSGVTYYAAVNHILARGILDSLGIANTKVVRLQGGAKLVQALVAGDIDFAIMTSAHAVTNAGGHCFLTTAPTDFARSKNQESIQEINSKNPWIGKGHMYTFIGMNLGKDKSTVQQIAVETVNTSEITNSQFGLNAYKAGIAAGESEEQQWKRVGDHIKSYTNLGKQ